MKEFLNDLLTAILMGLILPGFLFNAAAKLLCQPDVQAATLPTTVSQSQEESVTLPVLVRSRDDIVEEQDLDAYLVGVVLAEMPADFEPEALKAQSVAARTYAWKAYVTGGKHGDGSVCTQPSCCQAYIDPADFLSQGGTMTSLAKVEQAVAATSGYVLTYEGELIEATYFSCSGGRTEDAAAVWGVSFPYLQALDSPGEEDAVHYADTFTLTAEAFQQALGLSLSESPDQWFSDVTFTEGGGIASVCIGGQLFSGTQLRSLLNLPSTSFSIQAEGNQLVITTHGYGHRVGMSQYGADAMAVRGSSWQEILAYYYPGTTLTLAAESDKS